jgi:hypothetical protein
MDRDEKNILAIKTILDSKIFRLFLTIQLAKENHPYA